MKWVISNQAEFVGLGSSRGIDSTRSLNAPPHDIPSPSLSSPSPSPSDFVQSTSASLPTRSTTAPTPASQPSSQTLEFNQFAGSGTIETLKQRRPRPASYHGRPSHLSLHNRGQSGSVRTGGVRPLQLPIKVASTATSRAGSPRLNSDVTLPGGDDEVAALDYATSPQTAPPVRTRFQLEDSGAVPPSPTNAGAAPTAIRHRRISSEQVFAQQERESLLFRIAELERALHDREQGEESGAVPPNETSTLADETKPEPEESGSRYPSPPASPPDAASAARTQALTRPSPSPRVQTQTRTPRRMKSLLDQNFAVSSPEEEDLHLHNHDHETRVLDEESSSHPKLLLISPTLPPPPRPSAGGESEGEDVFGDADEVSSPTRA